MTVHCGIIGLLLCLGKEGVMNSFRVRNVNGMVGEGVKFERIRRITGYLTGSIERFNPGKAAELHDRVKHSVHGLSEDRKEVP